MKFYLASPLGFAESTQLFMDDLIDSLSQVIDVVNPWDDHRFIEPLAEASKIVGFDDRIARLHEINGQIGAANVERIDGCDGVIAVLDGVDIDSGTASEIGYAYARDKIIFGLRTDFRLAGDNAGSIVNLQVQYFIENSNGAVLTTVEDLLAAIRRQEHI